MGAVGDPRRRHAFHPGPIVELSRSLEAPWPARDGGRGKRTMTVALMLAAMFALVLINVPIAVALAIIASAAILITQGAHMLPNVALVMFDGATSFPLLAIPLFIMAGAIMNASGISQRLIAPAMMN